MLNINFSYGWEPVLIHWILVLVICIIWKQFFIGTSVSNTKSKIIFSDFRQYLPTNQFLTLVEQAEQALQLWRHLGKCVLGVPHDLENYFVGSFGVHVDILSIST